VANEISTGGSANVIRTVTRSSTSATAFVADYDANERWKGNWLRHSADGPLRFLRLVLYSDERGVIYEAYPTSIQPERRVAGPEGGEGAVLPSPDEGPVRQR
jgi:hypothetical protein